MRGRGRKRQQAAGAVANRGRPPFSLSCARPLITISLEQRNLVLYNKIRRYTKGNTLKTKSGKLGNILFYLLSRFGLEVAQRGKLMLSEGTTFQDSEWQSPCPLQDSKPPKLSRNQKHGICTP